MTTDDNSPPSVPEMVIEELASRIGKITSQYEVEMAALKAQAMQQISALQQRLVELTPKVEKDA